MSQSEIETDPLQGYIVERPLVYRGGGRGLIRGCLIVWQGSLGNNSTPSNKILDMVMDNEPVEPYPHQGKASAPGDLQAVGRLQRIGRLQEISPLSTQSPGGLVPVASGETYHISSPQEYGLATPDLVKALEQVFERFAQQHGYTSQKPLEISLERGYAAKSPGHFEGRAVDISTVGGQPLAEWKRSWKQVTREAKSLVSQQDRAVALDAERGRNLGYGLYKALQDYEGWRINPGGWQPYRGVEQLFGPWTAVEGPWKRLLIANPTPQQVQSLRHQDWVFKAHQDHIHVAR